MSRAMEQSPEQSIPADPEAGPPADAGADPRALRLAVLRPHFDGICSWAATVDPEDVPHLADLGVFQVDLGSWERRLLKSWDGDDRECGLLAESITYEIKCQELAEIFEHGPMPAPAELAAFLERLMLTVAVGQALAEELQWSINRLIGEGRLPDAKSQTHFRIKVVKTLDQVKQRLGTAELERAESRAESMLSVRVVPEPSLEPPALREKEPESHTWASYGPEESEEEEPLPPWLTPEAEQPAGQQQAAVGPGPNRVAPLLITLGVLLGLYVVVLVPRLSQTTGPPQLTRVQFSHIDGLAAISARPPSLYVTVRHDAWKVMTTEQRGQLLAEVSQVAATAGYSGMIARTPDGVTVGQWMQKTGVRLVEPHAERQKGAPT